MSKTREEIIYKLASKARTTPFTVKELIKIEKTHNLGYGHIVEFGGKDLARILYVLRHYCKLKCLPSLEIVAANLKNKQDIDAMANQDATSIIAHLCAVDASTAIHLVKSIDELDKKTNEMFASTFARALANGINASCGGHAITYSDIESAHEHDMSLNEYLFMKSFNESIAMDVDWLVEGDGDNPKP